MFHTQPGRPKGVQVVLATVLGVMLGLVACGAAYAQTGIEQSLGDSRIKGGLCVILGAADAEPATTVAANGAFVVQCLSTDAARVDALRQALLAKKLYGRVSAEECSRETLPYADDIVSLLVVLDPGKTTEAERLRVVRPGGEMLAGQCGGFKATVKPHPAGTDAPLPATLETLWTAPIEGPDTTGLAASE